MSKNTSIKKNDTGKAKSQTKSKSSTPSTTTKQSPTGMILQRAMAMPESLSVQDVYQLQGMVGNRSVGSLLQRTPRNEFQPRPTNVPAPLMPRPYAIQRKTPTYSPSFRLHQSPNQTQPVQRLVSRDVFERLAGAPSGTAKFNRSTYTKILHKLDKVNLYTEQNNTKKKEEKLKDLIKLIESWIGSHTDNGDLKDSADRRKYTFLSGLKMEAEVELGTRTDPLPQNDMSMPSQAAAAWAKMAEMAVQLDKSVTNELVDNHEREENDKNRYVFSVFVDIVNLDDREYIAKRTQLSIENEKQKYLNNKRRKKNEVRIKSSQEIKQETATYVVDTKYKYDLTTKQGVNKRNKHIKDLVDNAGTSGHTWIKLSAFSSENELVSEKSVGFWPLAGTMGIKNTVPGVIKSPDPVPEKYQLETEDDLGIKVKKQGLRRFDTVITAGDYRRAMNYVIGQMKKPRDYDLSRYNCTTFAKEVADQAGASLPQKSYLAVPGGVTDVALGRTSVRLYSPDELYHALGDKADDFHNTYITKPEDTTLQQQETQWIDVMKNVTLDLFSDLAILPDFMKDGTGYPIFANEMVEEMAEANCGIDGLFDILDDSWNGEDVSLVTYDPFGQTPYMVRNDKLKAFKETVKSKMQERDEFRELARKTNVYIPPPLRKKKSPESTESSEQSQQQTAPKRVMKKERAEGLFQRHFRSEYRSDFLVLQKSVPLYSESFDETITFNSGDRIRASMFFNDQVSVEDADFNLYVADPATLADALGWWD